MSVQNPDRLVTKQDLADFYSGILPYLQGGSADRHSITVTTSSSGAGQTITCTKGTATYTETIPSASPYEVTFNNLSEGTWTLTFNNTTKTVVISDSYSETFS